MFIRVGYLKVERKREKMIKNILKSILILFTFIIFYAHAENFDNIKIDEKISLKGSERFISKRMSEHKRDVTKKKENIKKDTVLPIANEGAKEIIVGVVMDGDSPRTEKIVKLIMKQVKLLENDEFIVRFPKSKRLSGKWQKKGINSALTQLYNDKEVDIVMSIGISSSTLTVMRENHPKPTIATLVIDNKLGNIPFNGISSGKDNLTYIAIQANMEEELKSFQKLVKFKRPTLITDALFADIMPQLAKKGRNKSKNMGLKLSLFPHKGGKIKLTSLPKGTDAILLGTLPRLSLKNKKKLIHALTKKGLPVYGLVSKESVRQGALLSTVPDENWEQRTRRIALYVQGISYGENLKDMNVVVSGHKRMTINMETARKLNISPSFDLLLESDQINMHKRKMNTYWSLSQIAKRALHENLSVRASSLNRNIGTTYINESRSMLLPKFTANIDQQYHQGNREGTIAKRSSRAAVNLSQLLYDESAWANFDIERLKQTIRDASHKQVELDTVKNATMAFLEVLKAKTLRDISEESVYLSRNNLKMAQDKSMIGSASNADVYRWETQLANNKTTLLSAESSLKQSQENVNQLLNRPLTETFDVDTNIMKEPLLIVNDKRLVGYMRNARNYRHLSAVLIRLGLDRSPLIATYVTNLVIEKRRLTSENRSDWVPKVTLNGEYSYMFDDSRVATYSQDGDDDWSVGINFSLPLYEGGAKKERKTRSKLISMQLRLELEDIKRTIEQQIRASLHTLKASKLSIDLKKVSSKAAQKNFELVSEAYSLGSVTNIELIDAQNSKVTAKLNMINSTYQFLIDLMNLQYTTGGFDFFLDKGERKQIVNEMSRQIKRRN